MWVWLAGDSLSRVIQQPDPAEGPKTKLRTL